MHLESNRTTLEEAVSDVPATRRERRPAAERWSVAEILEHLGIVEGSITQLLRARIDAARTSGLRQELETSPIVPTVPVARLLDRRRTIVASARSLPTGSLDATSAWQVLTERRRALSDFVVAADGLALSDVVIPHPILGPLNAYQWLVFVGAHEGRHAGQIREIAGSFGAS